MSKVKILRTRPTRLVWAMLDAGWELPVGKSDKDRARQRAHRAVSNGVACRREVRDEQ